MRPGWFRIGISIALGLGLGTNPLGATGILGQGEEVLPGRSHTKIPYRARTPRTLWGRASSTTTPDLVFRKEGDPTPTTVFAPSDTVVLAVGRGLERGVLRILDPADGSERLVQEFTGQETRFPVSGLLRASPGRGYSVFATTDNGDAPAFHEAMKSAGGRGELPSLPMDIVLEPEHHNHDPDGWSRRFFHGAGVPFDVVVEGDTGRFTGSLRVLATPAWIYFSGHYPSGSGGDLGGATIRPDVEGAPDVWEGRLEVLIFASCYAVDLWTEPGQEGLELDAGIDGRLWWERFHGTLLGYRGSAPSTGADAVARRFVKLASAIRSHPGSDREGYSEALARAWMKANGEISATWATAIDARGTYYRFDGSRLRTIPRSQWQAANDAALVYQQDLAPGMQALKWELARLTGVRPASRSQLEGAEAYRDLMANPRVLALVGSREALEARILEWWRYDLHVFYETDIRLMMLVMRMKAALKRKPTVAEVMAEWTPDAGHREELAIWRAGRGRTGLDLMVDDPTTPALVEEVIDRRLIPLTPPVRPAIRQ